MLIYQVKSQFLVVCVVRMVPFHPCGLEQIHGIRKSCCNASERR